MYVTYLLGATGGKGREGGVVCDCVRCGVSFLCLSFRGSSIHSKPAGSSLLKARRYSIAVLHLWILLVLSVVWCGLCGWEGQELPREMSGVFSPMSLTHTSQTGTRLCCSLLARAWREKQKQCISMGRTFIHAVCVVACMFVDADIG